ncbi:MAG: VPDSG-CTERM sorting domain-containing protein [Verrucomicrobiota bacterium]
MKTKISKFCTLTPALTIAVTLVAASISANALAFNDSYYIGSVVDATPSGAQEELNYMEFLVSMTVGTTDTATNGALGNGGNQNEVHTFTRSTNVFTPLPTPSGAFTPALTAATNSWSFDITGYTYLYGKFGQNGYAWYVGDLTGTQTLPNQLSGPSTGLSHIALFNWTPPDDTPGVPDGGTTLVLLGGSLLGLGSFRRLMSKKS